MDWCNKRLKKQGLVSYLIRRPVAGYPDARLRTDSDLLLIEPARTFAVLLAVKMNHTALPGYPCLYTFKNKGDEIIWIAWGFDPNRDYFEKARF